jgi:flavin-dependent dehydrogenase
MSGLSDIVIVGGGPAGAAAAIVLARAGRHVVLLERHAGPVPKVCGEFLSAEALGALARLGLPAAGLGAAQIRRVRLTASGEGAEAELPFTAAGLDRAALDSALLAAAEQAGAIIRRGANVRAVSDGEDEAGILLGSGRLLRARHVLLATGKQDLPGETRDTSWRRRSSMIGLRMPLRLSSAAALRLGAAVELHLFRGGCAGLQPAGKAANLCITLDGALFRRAGCRFDTLLALIAAENAAFGDAIAASRPLAARPAAIARVPYGFLRRGRGADRLFRLGDQIAVTASFTGDGISIALESGIAAAEAILAARPAAAYEAAFLARARRQLRAAMALQALVDRPGLHGLAVAAVRAWPGLVRHVAAATRLPPPGPVPGNPDRDGSLAPPAAGPPASWQ